MPSPRTVADLRAELAAAEAAAAAEQESPIGLKDHLPKTLVPTTAKGWKNKLGTPQPLELPSENVCLVVRPGLPQLLKDGVLPDLLLPMAEKAVAASEGTSRQEVDEDVRELMAKPGGMDAMFDAAERIAAHVVKQPPVLYSRRQKKAGQIDQIQEGYEPEWELIPEEDRKEDVLYTDQVDFNDLMFIFQFVVGGSRDLEEFRKQTR
jgi:hypothetical protein